MNCSKRTQLPREDSRFRLVGVEAGQEQVLPPGVEAMTTAPPAPTVTRPPWKTAVRMTMLRSKVSLKPMNPMHPEYAPLGPPGDWSATQPANHCQANATAPTMYFKPHEPVDESLLGEQQGVLQDSSIAPDHRALRGYVVEGIWLDG